MNGMSYPEIANVINKAISTSYDTLKFIQKRYLIKYVCALKKIKFYK